jgi:hypothetical protein
MAALCVAGTGWSPARERPAPPPLATVTLTDVVTGMQRLGEQQVEYRLTAAPGRRDPLTAPRVLVDERKTKVGPAAKLAVAFQGRLTTKEVVVGMTGSIPPRKITAAGLYLVAQQATPITTENKAKFPPAGTARVQGKGLAGTFPAGGGVDARHAIANGDRPILLLGRDGKPLRDVRVAGTVTATGRLRVAGNGVLVLEAETVESNPQDR